MKHLPAIGELPAYYSELLDSNSVWVTIDKQAERGYCEEQLQPHSWLIGHHMVNIRLPVCDIPVNYLRPKQHILVTHSYFEVHRQINTCPHTFQLVNRCAYNRQTTLFRALFIEITWKGILHSSTISFRNENAVYGIEVLSLWASFYWVYKVIWDWNVGKKETNASIRRKLSLQTCLNNSVES